MFKCDPIEPKIYSGQLRHRRFHPKAHQFNYAVFMLYGNCKGAEHFSLGALIGPKFWHWLRFRREDFHGDPACDLDTAVRKTVQAATGKVPQGPITFLANYRTLGISMNPLTTYYCWNTQADQVDYIVAEVNNTPWDERHAYVLSCDNTDKQDLTFNKVFQVSPFNPINMRYRWVSTAPLHSLLVHIENWQVKGGVEVKVMDATLNMQASDLTAANVRTLLLKIPFMSIKVLSAIYWQALRLWLKKVPFLGRSRNPNPVENIALVQGQNRK